MESAGYGHRELPRNHTYVIRFYFTTVNRRF